MSGTDADAKLSNVECLLLAQAVYEHGANAWNQVSKLLSKHPLLSRPKHFFSSNSCRAIYTHLMNEAQLECSDDNNAVHAPANLKLAQKFYGARLVELRDLIAAEEARFRTILAEIQDIRDGKWDTRICVKLSGVEIEPQLEPDHAIVLLPDVSSETYGREQDSSEHLIHEPGRPDSIPQPQEEPDEPERVGPSPGFELMPLEEEISYLLQSEEHESENDERSDIEVQLIEVDEPLASTREEADQREEDQQPTSLDDEASEIEAILTPEPLEGSADGKAREQPTEHEAESSGPEHEVDSHEQEILSPPQYTATSYTEQEDEAPIHVDTKERDVSVVTEICLPGKRKVSGSDGVDEPERKRLREESSAATLGDEDTVARSQRGTTGSDQRPGPYTPTPSTPSASTGQVQPAPNKRFQAVITLLHSQISQHRNGNIFHNPIKPSEAPDYHDIIKRPMDLKTIKARIKDGVTRTSMDFQRDVYLMFANAMMYNRPGSDIALMAEEMMLESEVHINTFRQTEGYLRNTRT